ncbi:hypothetical protein LR48_Vigan07g157400 [Vigna angularis]|uniref:Uncharacterized protein n=1 Tax=Phaseolus angularis TaxID=3914 RepID=A0A0L9UYD3_PHAAN|nr:hypothetical protein LR48_Vigan07g157400 [Vigna angularis]
MKQCWRQYRRKQQWRRKHRQARALAATVAETGDVPMAAAVAEETLAGQRWRVGEGWRRDQQRGRAALNARALAAVVAEVHRRGTKVKGGESRGANRGSEESEEKTESTSVQCLTEALRVPAVEQVRSSSWTGVCQVVLASVVWASVRLQTEVIGYTLGTGFQVTEAIGCRLGFGFWPNRGSS